MTLFPNIWTSVSGKLGFERGSQKLLHHQSEKQGIFKYIGIWFALWPIFSSCSPTYALILAIILPASLIWGISALIAYILWLATVLLLIAFLWQKVISKMWWASAAHGKFKRILWVIFIVIGVCIITGLDKKIEIKLLDMWILNTTNFEQNIIDAIEIDSFNDTSGSIKVETELSFLGSVDTNTCSWGTCENKQFSWEQGDMIGREAPEFTDVTGWINSPAIDSIQDLRGKVVMIDFWTRWCINCIATHAQTQEIYEKYRDQWLVVIGLHTPEFAYERNINLVKSAVEEFGISFPVAQDNEFSTWRKYQNRYWPAFYIIDKQGVIRETHFWDGGKEKKQVTIEKLLSESI